MYASYVILSSNAELQFNTEYLQLAGEAVSRRGIKVLYYLTQTAKQHCSHQISEYSTLAKGACKRERERERELVEREEAMHEPSLTCRSLYSPLHGKHPFELSHIIQGACNPKL